MSNTISNILTIIGTEKKVAEVRNFIKGSKGESISFQSIIPMPKKLKGKRMIEMEEWPIPPGCDGPITIPDWEYWRMMCWGPIWDAEPIRDDAVDAPNRILFNTSSSTPLPAMVALSELFPEVTINIIFSDACPELYCGEYTITGGEVTNKVWYDGIAHIGDISVDQQMEYYFRTHEYAREEWKKGEDGKWVYIYDEDLDEE